MVAPQHGGLKLTGRGAAKHARQLSLAAVDFPLVFDAEAYCEYDATPEQPFFLPTHQLFPQTLSERLDDFRNLGASIAFTPTGHLSAEGEALEEAVQTVNDLDRDDLILSLPLDHSWLTSEVNFARLRSQLEECAHACSISIAHPQDPLEEPNVGRRLRELARLSNAPYLDRVDLVGLDYVANGGPGSTIGLSSRLRHGQSQLIQGMSYSSTDNRASVLWPGLLRFVRPIFLEQQLYPGLEGPLCDCPFCDGRALTTFTNKKKSQQRARDHNAWCLQMLTRSVLEPGGSGSRREVWKGLVLTAIEAHERLRVELNQPGFGTPVGLEHWVW